MKELITITLSKEGEPKYKTYFYHKHSQIAYEVISNGTECAISLRDRCAISISMKHGSSLPKYISDKIGHRR